MSRSKRLRIAFVVPRAGEEVTGGAEAFCLTAARELAVNHDVEILTTCAIDYSTWANHYEEGTTNVRGVAVRRFAVDAPRDPRRFNQMSRRFRYRLTALTLEEQELWLREQGPYSTSLLRYLWDQREQYDAFVFFTYLYATTYFGLPLVEQRAYLAPLAHDEWPIYLPAWKRFFERPLGFLYVSDEERDFVRRHFRGIDVTGSICDMPVPQYGDANPQRFRNAHNIDEPFLLYVGRIDASKGCHELCEMYSSYSRVNRNAPLLIFAGHGSGTLPQHDRIRALGYVEDRTKWDALAACDTFVMPSPHESLSIALLEAWASGKPAIVNASSAALVGQCRRANGGLWYSDQRSFNVVMDLLSSELRVALGRQGHRFFERRYMRGNVAESFEDLLGDLSLR